jgi:ribosomal protein S15P/S13E
MIKRINELLVKNFVFIIIVMFLVLLLKKEQIIPLKENDYKPLLKSVAFNDYGNDLNIKSYSIVLNSRNINSLKNNIDVLIKEFDGSVENFNSNNNNFYWTIKIKTSDFEGFKNKLKKYSVVSENLNLESAKKQLITNEEKLKNLLEKKQQLQDFFKTEEKDRLQIYRELSYIQNDIDRIIEQNRQIDLDIEYTKINITIRPKNFAINSWSFSNSWDKAINNSIILSQKLFELLCNLFVFSPIILIIVLIKKYKK